MKLPFIPLDTKTRDNFSHKALLVADAGEKTSYSGLDLIFYCFCTNKRLQDIPLHTREGYSIWKQTGSEVGFNLRNVHVTIM